MSGPPNTLRQRGDRLVTRVLEATLIELARVGYEHLSIENIASRAGVNKTTIYRRWATTDALALSALESASDRDGLPDTGSLRGDLIAYLTGFREVCRTPAMLSLARMYFYGDASSPLNTIIRERVHQTQCSALLMFQRAIDRGELPPNTDIECLRDLFLGGAQSLILFQQEELSDEKLERTVSVLLLGAAAGAQSSPGEP